MNKRTAKNTEWNILICVILLTIIGLIALYSATINSDLYEFKKQCIFVVISIPILIITMIVDYSILVRFSPYLYGLSIILLIAVLFTGAINGATSWFNIGFFAFQPAELAKVFVIMFLSSTIVNIQKQSKKDINKISKLAMVLGIAFLPVLLIAIQPDFGTAIVYIISLILILYVAGIDRKYIIISFIILLITIPLMYFFILPAHAKSRIDVFLNPDLDPRGAGYNIIQSKIAIGAGKLFGMGWLKGTQTHLGFLYPKTTDFIYSMIGEELGFITCSIIIVIYVILITKSIAVAKTARDDLGSYIAMGIVRSIIIPCG
ncbi:MAG: rod shape-determining protein RodA [Clostridia bacterium]|nr:rod shape-determining protein RodA [Clostridia bacterium]